MTDEKIYKTDPETGDLIYRIPGKHHGDGQIDSDDNPVWLLAGDEPLTAEQAEIQHMTNIS